MTYKIYQKVDTNYFYAITVIDSVPYIATARGWQSVYENVLADVAYFAYIKGLQEMLETIKDKKITKEITI